jgi:hypothetical protein
MTDQRRWTHEELKTILERSPIADLEKLIAHPEKKYRPEMANDCAISALRNITESEVLPDDQGVALKEKTCVCSLQQTSVLQARTSFLWALYHSMGTG